jgi:methylenetetrahydrofolate reductase (NADPH)
MTEMFDLSFEFFPPKTEPMAQALWESLEKLTILSPSFVSVTYGAGGSTRTQTHSIVKHILENTSLAPAAHLTCVGSPIEVLDNIICEYRSLGVRHIVALRGDPERGIGTPFVPIEGGCNSSVDLISFIRQRGDFEISVAAYPERHPESRSWEEDLDLLERKVEAGGKRVLTQFFFDNAHYFRFLDKVQARNIQVPIVPGLLPIHSLHQVARFAGRVGAQIPDSIIHRFDGIDEKSHAYREHAIALAAEQISELMKNGVNAFHFYTMNRSDLIIPIARQTELRTNFPEAA